MRSKTSSTSVSSSSMSAMLHNNKK